MLGISLLVVMGWAVGYAVYDSYQDDDDEPAAEEVTEITGTPGDDDLVGDDGPNSILGFVGNDHMSGLGGDDRLDGGDGDDFVAGDDGNDRVLGGEGDDIVKGGAKSAAQKAFDMAGLTPADVDFAELYDCFTVTPILLAEELGFAAEGEGWNLWQDGQAGIDGPFPINTHGGMLRDRKSVV